MKNKKAKCPYCKNDMKMTYIEIKRIGEKTEEHLVWECLKCFEEKNDENTKN